MLPEGDHLLKPAELDGTDDRKCSRETDVLDGQNIEPAKLLKCVRLCQGNTLH